MKSTFEIVWAAAERTPDHLAIVDDRTNRALSYRALISQVETIAAGLHARGIREGHRIAIALPNQFEHCLMILAARRLGAVPALINFRLQPPQIAALVARQEMQAAVIRPDGALAEAVAAALPENGALFCAGEAQGLAQSLSSCVGKVESLPPVRRLQADDPAFIFHTSGTTGTPKAVLIPHRAEELRITWVSPIIGLRCGPELKTIGVAPLSHAIGCHGSFLATLALNGTYYVMSAFNPAAAVDMIESRQISFLFGVPTVFQAMLDAPNYAPAKLRSLQHVVYGGATIPPRLLERITHEWPGEVTNGYGSTEANFVLYARNPAGRHRMLRAGYPARTRIIRSGQNPDDVCAPGESGELIVDAAVDGVFAGYLGDSAATSNKIRDGWYFTGDVCIPHANGEVELVGRVDDMIRSGGESIYPEEVEAVIAGHPGVAEVCVTGVPHKFWGQAVVAWVVLKDSNVTWRELDQACAGSALAGFKRPKAYCFVKELPRNESNKVQRRALSDNLPEGSLQYVAA